MRCLRRGNVLGAAITQLEEVDTGKQALAAAEEHGRERQMDLVDEAGSQILVNRRDTSADLNILALGCFQCFVACEVNPARHKMECRSALHDDRLTRVVRQHEHGHLKWRSLSPPSLPALVGPGSAKRAEHVSSENPRADVLEAPRGKVIVDAG